jgi:predicted TIM-barrel fold metal-dependent hydrolase
MHLFDRRFPPVPGDTRQVPDASVADYCLLQERIGTSRVVVVQPSTYGTDNRCTLEGLATLGPAARGVAVVDTTVSDEELHRLDSLGVRGIRFNLARAGSTTVEMLEALASRVGPLGWHVQIHAHAAAIVELKPLLARLAAPIVFDHMGRIPPVAGVDHPAYCVIRDFLDRGRTWVKLSGPYFESKSGAPGYSDVSGLAEAFARAAPERMVWGSDWPHPGATRPQDDAELFDLLEQWVPDEASRRLILVENPAALYGFPAAI